MDELLDAEREAGVADGVVARLRETFATGTTRLIAWRRAQLSALERMLDEQGGAIEEVLAQDLGKPPLEAYLSEIASTRAEIRALLAGLGRWSRPERVRLPVALQPGRAHVRREPLGVVLVIAPWNYPVNLVLAPLAAALAAGNCVVVKPSEVTARTSALLASLLPRYLDDRAVAVVEGGPEVNQALIAQRVDHVFFTGSSAVGRLVMQAAAAQLTPVTLELGAKSPAIVSRDANLAVAARRVAWGRFFNAGQTCVAPDYVLVERAVADAFTGLVADAVRAFYGADPRTSADFARIVDDRHLVRLAGLLEHHGGALVTGGVVEREARYVAPTVLRDVDPAAPVMQEEIFGPILPILPVEDLDEAVRFVAARPTPLTVYLFARDRRCARRVAAETRSGALSVNATLQHFAVPALPFGGLGESGIGAYHGRWGFEAFSHRRAVLARPARADLALLYPPYSRRAGAFLRRLL